VHIISSSSMLNTIYLCGLFCSISAGILLLALLFCVLVQSWVWQCLLFVCVILSYSQLFLQKSQ